MIHLLSDEPSIASYFISQLRDVELQKDGMRFRKNLERIGEIFAFEISKTFQYTSTEVETPLGTAIVEIPEKDIVLATILRAGLPMHQGMLNFYDFAENAFVTAFRKHHKNGSFEINLQYITCPNIDNKILIVIDPMLATGQSIVKTLQELARYGTPKIIHIVTAVAAREGVDYVEAYMPKAHLWIGAIDEELTAKSYIVPGLGDAGDLSFGRKVQN